MSGKCTRGHRPPDPGQGARMWWLTERAQALEYRREIDRERERCDSGSDLVTLRSFDMGSHPRKQTPSGTSSPSSGRVRVQVQCVCESVVAALVSRHYLLKWSMIRSSRMFSGKFPTQRCRVSLTIVV